MTVHVTVAIDESTKADMDALALARGLGIDDMLAEAVTTYVGDQRELEAAIAAAEASLAAGQFSSHEDVVARLRARRADWSVSG